MALNANDVQQLYVAYLGRAADTAGLEYWTEQVPEDFTLADLRYSLVNDQPEYQALYGDKSREELVTAIYQNMFGRDPEAAGLEYWVDGEGGAVPADELMQLFIDAASEEDRTAFEAKVEDANENPTDPEVPSDTINVEFTDIPGGATSLTQTIDEIGRAEWDEAGRPVTTSADYTFQLSNQLGADESYEGLFLSPMLTSDTLSSNSQLFIELLDVRAAGTDEPLGNLPIDGVRFQLGDEVVVLRSDDIFAAKTYAELQAAIEAAIAEDSDLAGLSVAQGASFTATDGDEPIPGAVGTTIVLTDAQGREVSDPQFTYSDQQTGGFTLYGDLSTEAPESTRELIETNLELNNVGYGSQGGSINIAGESNSDKGVELFNVEATNGVWLTRLESETVTGTHALKEINLTGSGYFNVGVQDNANVVGIAGNYLSAWTDAGLVDVQNFNGQNFDGDIKLSSYITDEVIARDLQSDDTQDEPTAEDVTYAYQTADGDDQISLAVQEELLERADAQVYINAGNGDNVVETVFVNGPAALTNQQLNGNITIVTGSGDDVVRTWGAGDAEISTGAGDDVIYADNSGLLIPGPDTDQYNRDFWEFNSTAGAGTTPTGVSNSDTDLSSVANGVDQTFNVASDANVQVQVTFKGFESVWVNVPTTRTSNDNDDQITTLQVNQAIKNAVNNDAVLQNLIEANDGNGNILNIATLIDANNLGELEIAFRDNNDDTTADLTAIEAIYGSEGTSADTVAATSEGGTESTFESDNVINAGAGDDVIVLGTGEFSNDTVVLEGNFGTNSIVNFTAGEVVGGEVTTPAVAEVVTVTFSDTDLTGQSELVFDGESLDVTALDATATAGQIAALFEDFESASWTAEVDGGTVTFTATSGGDIADLEATDFSVAAVVAPDGITVDVQGADAVSDNANGADILDFTAYGVNGATVDTTAEYNVSNDQVNVVEFDEASFTRDGVTFSNLTAADVKAAIGDTVASGRIDSIILVENDTNAGEYMAFDVNSASNSTAFTVELIGVLDFGAAQTFDDSNFA